jgi:hypothetical protein
MSAWASASASASATATAMASAASASAFQTISSVHRLAHGAGHEMLIDDVQVIIEK